MTEPSRSQASGANFAGPTGTDPTQLGAAPPEVKLLDYAVPHATTWQKWIRSYRWWIIGLAIVATAVVVGRASFDAYRRWQAARYASAFRVVDADVPGTEVYLGNRRLGRVPLLLSKQDCLRLGIPIAPVSTQELIASDGWGEGILMGSNKGGPQVRLTLKAPSNAPYLSFDTIDGPRTKHGGGRDLPNGFKAHLFTHREEDDLILSFQMSASVKVGDPPTPVMITITNNGTAPFVGVRPYIEFHWGNADTAWPHRHQRTVPLPLSWQRVAPGATLRATVAMPVPSTPGAYGVYVTFDLFMAGNSGYLTSPGSIYSDSHLLRVK